MNEREAANHPMQPSGEVGRFEVDDQPSPPADRYRSSGKRAINVTPCHRFYYVLGDFAGV